VFLTIRTWGPPLSYVHYADFFQKWPLIRSMFRTAVKTDSAAAGSATRARSGQLLHHLLLLQLLLQDSCLARLGEELLLLAQEFLLGDAEVLQARALSPPLGRRLLALLHHLTDNRR
jgi:hypothetical protein